MTPFTVSKSTNFTSFKEARLVSAELKITHLGASLTKSGCILLNSVYSDNSEPTLAAAFNAIPFS